MMRTSPVVPVRCGGALGVSVIAALLWGCGARLASAPRDAAIASFLSARLRGAIDADIAWKAPDLGAEGGARPDGSGIRVSLGGALGPGGQRARLVFGIAARPGQPGARNVPTNLTLIVEGANRIYATLGDDKCSVDALTQQPVAAAGSGAATAPGNAPAPAPGDYWVEARGFCIEPAATLDGAERVLLSRFDFRGRIHLEEADLRAAAHGS
jgi:hypothetical protein